MPVKLTQDQIDFYNEQGYLAVPGVLSGDKLEALRRETDRVVAAAAGETGHGEIYDLEDSHTPSNPRVRRIKEPFRHFDFFSKLARDPDITDIIAQLLGENLRLYGGKMNTKSAGYGAPVEWHQDWAFYPHTNDDVLATGLLLDDCDERNGPLLVMPGTHKGPTFDHHADGAFCGAIDPLAGDLDYSKAVPLVGKAGDMTIHHVRLVHGSAMNTSNRQRRLLLHEYAAADAWPLTGMRGDFEEFYYRRMVRGEPTNEMRNTDVPVRMPYPAAELQGSIYENQKGRGSRYFETYEKKRQAAT